VSVRHDVIVRADCLHDTLFDCIDKTLRNPRMCIKPLSGLGGTAVSKSVCASRCVQVGVLKRPEITVHRGKSSHRRIFRYVTSHVAGAETTYRESYAKSMHLPAK
jgi:hypothetical protein